MIVSTKRLIIKSLPLTLFLFTIFGYDKKFMRGKYFENSYIGFVWLLRGLWFQKLLGFNRLIPWPIHHTAYISDYKNIDFHPEALRNFQSPGCYFQNINATIYLAKNCYISPNVGLITSNHNFEDLSDHHEGKDIVIGEDCWIGMNSVVLPGVVLGPNTIVGAGSVVNKSFPDGRVLIAGVPASIKKKW